MPYLSVFCLNKRYFSEIIVLGRASSGFIAGLTRTLDSSCWYLENQRETLSPSDSATTKHRHDAGETMGALGRVLPGHIQVRVGISLEEEWD